MIDNIERAMCHGDCTFYWLEDPTPHIIFFYQDRRGRQQHLHGHGKTRDEAVLDLNNLLKDFHNGRERIEDERS